MKSLDRLIAAFRRLPGVGPRQAERFSSYFLRASDAEAGEFMAALSALKANVKNCRRCFNYSEDELCPLCRDESRDASAICVVEDPQDIEAIEKTGGFKGYYHVLGGAISPVDGIGIDSIRVRELVNRIKSGKVRIEEVIVATDPDTEGESTALYLADLLRGLVPRITRIAYGVPLGGDLDYTDEVTLGHSLRGRTAI